MTKWPIAPPPGAGSMTPLVKVFGCRPSPVARLGMGPAYENRPPRHGGDRWETRRAAQLGKTRIHSTLSGGRHYLFRHADGVRNGAGKLAPGIDVRGEGGYVIMPPSPGYSVIHHRDLRAMEPTPRATLRARITTTRRLSTGRRGCCGKY